MQANFIVGAVTWVSELKNVTRRETGERQSRIEFRVQVDNTSVDVVTWGIWAEFVHNLPISTLPCVALFGVYRLPQETGGYKFLALDDR